MKSLRDGYGLAYATVVWAMVWCGDLVAAWMHSPYDRWGWFAAMGWVLAVYRIGRKALRPDVRWLVASWLASGVGVAGELNAAQHMGLALAGAAWVGGGWRGVGLLTLAVGWMPLVGWFARGWSVDGVAGCRLMVGVGCVMLAFFERRHV